MKTILVDAVYCLVSREGEIFEDMYKMLEQYPNNKIILSGADDEQFKKWNLDKLPYPVFTIKHNPEKFEPAYYHTLLKQYGLEAEDCIYFEHSEPAVASAQEAGIVTYLYDDTKKDLSALKTFLDNNL